MIQHEHLVLEPAITKAMETEEDIFSPVVMALLYKCADEAVEKKIQHRSNVRVILRFEDPAMPTAPDELAVIKMQHQAIDLLFARLIEIDPTFRPSKSGLPWDACQAGGAYLRAVEHD